MGQDPNQPYSNPYGQPPQPGSAQPPEGGYNQGYSQQGGYQPQPQQPPQGAYQPPYQPGPGFQPGPGYQQPYQQPVQNFASHPNGPTSMNMDPNMAAGLSYLAGWVTGLIFFLMEKQNRFVRFHAMQSILSSVAVIIAYIIVTIITSLPLIGLIGIILWPLLSIASLILWLYLMINAFQGKYVKLPVIGDYAERYANAGTPGF